VSGSSHGFLILNSNGSFSFTPTANYIGNDSFTYTANNGISSSNVATVTITVNSALVLSESVSSGAGGGGGGGGGCFITSAINADDPSWVTDILNKHGFNQWMWRKLENFYSAVAESFLSILSTLANS
jgi:hypothetical protein